MKRRVIWGGLIVIGVGVAVADVICVSGFAYSSALLLGQPLGTVVAAAFLGALIGGLLGVAILFGRRLALNVDAASPDAGVCGRREMRLLELGAKRARVLGSQICGLNGQTFLGPTFDSGWLYFARSCNTFCSATRYGVYRYRSGRYELAGDRQRRCGLFHPLLSFETHRPEADAERPHLTRFARVDR